MCLFGDEVLEVAAMAEVCPTGPVGAAAIDVAATDVGPLTQLSHSTSLPVFVTLLPDWNGCLHLLQVKHF